MVCSFFRSIQIDKQFTGSNAGNGYSMRHDATGSCGGLPHTEWPDAPLPLNYIQSLFENVYSISPGLLQREVEFGYFTPNLFAQHEIIFHDDGTIKIQQGAGAGGQP